MAIAPYQQSIYSQGSFLSIAKFSVLSIFNITYALRRKKPGFYLICGLQRVFSSIKPGFWPFAISDPFDSEFYVMECCRGGFADIFDKYRQII